MNLLKPYMIGQVILLILILPVSSASGYMVYLTQTGEDGWIDWDGGSDGEYNGDDYAIDNLKMKVQGTWLDSERVRVYIFPTLGSDYYAPAESTSHTIRIQWQLSGILDAEDSGSKGTRLRFGYKLLKAWSYDKDYIVGIDYNTFSNPTVIEPSSDVTYDNTVISHYITKSLSTSYVYYVHSYVEVDIDEMFGQETRESDFYDGANKIEFISIRWSWNCVYNCPY